VEDRIVVKTTWNNITSAPRDGQWFYALNARTGAIYRAYWCPKRDCFAHTKTRNRVKPTHWDGGDLPLFGFGPRALSAP
jgi:hypothetical protein